MVSKFLAYLSVALMMLAASCTYAASLNGKDSESASALANSDESNKPKYILKCFANKHDCSILEIIPDAVESSDVAAAAMGGEGEAEYYKRSLSSEGASRAHLQRIIKRIFPSADLDAQQTSRLYKTEQINCLTGDCSLLTARINKRRNMNTLACVGDPYSSTGSRCLPIEGLYIG